jgi:type II secretory ATPase GspE/PulE/Tfp pilus assembly ATPase PilB-like protein
MCGFTQDQWEGATIYKAVGCSHCSNTGYRGRQGIFEMLEMNSELRDLAFNRADITRIRACGRASGMTTLLDDGQKKILRGITSLEELQRLAQAEVEVD